ncbi:MAG TPA: membrane protein insertase YidC [Candidatus Acidoferrales bacterium]|nr:membrane protein insertase YidC [Candidatus Acidoferrales bacterium]
MNEPESSDQIRMLLFIVLSILVFVATSYFFKPTQQPQQSEQSKQVTSPGPTETSKEKLPAAPPAPEKEKATTIPVVQEKAEKTFKVESPLYEVDFSNQGGVVRSWTLKKYFNDQTPPHPLDLVDPDTCKQLGWPFSLALADPQLETQVNSGFYKASVTQGGKTTEVAGGQSLTTPAEVTLEWSDGHTSVTKKLKFGANYEISIDLSVTHDGNAVPAALAWRGGFGDKEVYKASRYVNAFYEQNNKLETLAIKKLGVSGNQTQRAEQGSPLEFAGIMDEFFTAAFLADGPDLSLWHWVGEKKYMADDKPATEQVAEIAAGTAEPGPIHMRAFVGPKKLELLTAEHPSLEGLVQFGWTGVIAKPLLYALEWLHNYIPNYGWAIVVFTIVLTMVLFPIRLWTFRSSRKMQLVAPEVKAIQDRYKKYSMTDPRKRKMNEEVMALYQREGINPMGSCLPMLVQIPIIWAFYRMLEGAIELRHAPWILWIHDLSARDPYFVLPIVLAISSYLSTKLTPMPTTGDSSQQKMMTMMPLMTAFIFFYLSSGLNLYYFTNNVVNVLQQMYLNKTHPLPSRSKFKKNKE